MLSPPPMKIASGAGRPASAAGASPSTTFNAGVPSVMQFRSIISRRAELRSMAIARMRLLAVDCDGGAWDAEGIGTGAPDRLRLLEL